jgi:hypothetical protein
VVAVGLDLLSSLGTICIQWLMLMVFIVDASVGVAMYIHSAVCIAIQVGLGPVKSGGYEDPLAYMCDVSCIVISCNLAVST